MTGAVWISGLILANLWTAGDLGQDGSLRNVPKAPTPAAGANVVVATRLPCDQAPSKAEILRALPRPTGVSHFSEVFRDNIEIVTEKLTDSLDPPRLYPLIGPAQLYHSHWKCTVYFMETIEATHHPYLMKTQRRRAEVVYLDKDHLRLCAAETSQRA